MHGLFIGACVIKTAKQGSGGDWPAVERRRPGWAVDWQSAVERDKASLAESLHDDTGSFLVAAVMDITWAESHIRKDETAIKERLKRARSALELAIDLNRRMIEDLRPTLLDNFGLIAALKWHFAEVCKAEAIGCERHFPSPSPDFTPPAAIGLFRIGQTLLAMMVRLRASAITLQVAVDPEFVTLTMSCEGAPAGVAREDQTIADALISVTGRINALGGNMHFDAQAGEAAITCRVPTELALKAH